MAASRRSEAPPVRGSRRGGRVRHGPPRPSAREFAAGLWPLDARSGTARALLGHVDRATRPAERLTAFAAVVRQLLADPVLLPADWPDDAPLPAAGQRRAAVRLRGVPAGADAGEVRSRVGGA